MRKQWNSLVSGSTDRETVAASVQPPAPRKTEPQSCLERFKNLD